jgi:hypothetical protein
MRRFCSDNRSQLSAPAKHVDFEKAADAVMSMWNKLFATHGWW